MKKAVFIINSMQNGGAERVVETQAEFLRKSGLDVTVIFLRRWDQYELHPEIHRVYLSEKKVFTPFDYGVKLLPLVWRLNRVLKEISRNGEIILMTSNLLYPDVIARLSRYSGQIMAVIHGHQNLLPFADHFLYKKFVRWLYGSRQVICVSDSVEREMREVYGLKQGTIRTIGNPLDTERIERMMEEPLEYTRPFLLFCGRLTEAKRPDRALEAYWKGGLQKTYDLVYLGVGEMEQGLRKMAERWGIASSVHFAGWQSNAYKWMRNASLLVISSDSEGLSMVLLEALYCGCPVAAVRSQGPAQIMQGALREYLCDADADSLLTVMKKALERYPSDTAEYARAFEADSVMSEYLATYHVWNGKFL